MNTAVVNSVDRFAATSAEDLDLRKFLIYSVILHVFLALWIAVSIYFHLTGPKWSDVGGDRGQHQRKTRRPGVRNSHASAASRHR